MAKKLLKTILKRLGRRGTIAVSVILLLLVSWLVLSSRRSILKVSTSTVKRDTLVETISYSGKIAAEERADLSFESSGKIVWVGVKKGDFVNKGQGLASLDTIKLNSAYESALSDLRSAESTFQRVHDDLKGHDGNETFSQKETRTIAEVAKDKAYEAVIRARRDLNGATLIAPFDGIVANISSGVAPGVNVFIPTPAMILVNPRTYYFEAEVNEIDVTKLKIGQSVKLALDAFSDKDIEGKVETIDILNITTSTGGNAYKVRVSLPEGNKDNFKLGMSGDAEFILGELKDALLIPASSLVEIEDKKYVWVVGKDNKVEKKEVKVGASSVNDVEITSGLSQGEIIVNAPPSKLKNGDKISS